MAHPEYTPAQSVDRFWRRVEQTSACWIWTGAKKTDGYGYLIRSRHQIGAHRFIWQMTVGPIPAGFEVLHTCDIRPCVRNDDPGTYVVGSIIRPRYGHLWLGTHEDNMADMAQKGRGRMIREQHGEANPMARLTDATVREIRTLRLEGHSVDHIAQRYGVNEFTVRCVVQRKTWKHVT